MVEIMKVIIASIMIFSFINLIPGKKNRYWEDMNASEQAEVISNPKIDTLVINYYEGKIEVTDDEKTFELLETLSRPDSQVLPLYYYLFNKICLKSDGALSEVLGVYCAYMILYNPEYVINHFTITRKNTKNDKCLYEVYAELIGYEMYFKEERHSDLTYNFRQFKEILNEHVKNSEYKNTLELLYGKISETIQSMSD